MSYRKRAMCSSTRCCLMCSGSCSHSGVPSSMVFTCSYELFSSTPRLRHALNKSSKAAAMAAHAAVAPDTGERPAPVWHNPEHGGFVAQNSIPSLPYSTSATTYLCISPPLSLSSSGNQLCLSLSLSRAVPSCSAGRISVSLSVPLSLSHSLFLSPGASYLLLSLTLSMSPTSPSLSLHSTSPSSSRSSSSGSHNRGKRNSRSSIIRTRSGSEVVAVVAGGTRNSSGLEV